MILLVINNIIINYRVPEARPGPNSSNRTARTSRRHRDRLSAVWLLRTGSALTSARARDDGDSCWSRTAG